jgi:hypothetical protein
MAQLLFFFHPNRRPGANTNEFKDFYNVEKMGKITIATGTDCRYYFVIVPI